MQRVAHIAGPMGMLLLFMLCNSCSSKQSSSDYVHERVEELKRQTAPPNAFIKEIAEIASKGQSVSAQWEFDTARTRGDYLDWVTHRLRSNFVLESSTESRMIFGNHLRGDYESVTIETTRTSGALHVKVAYVIFPD